MRRMDNIEKKLDADSDSNGSMHITEFRNYMKEQKQEKRESESDKRAIQANRISFLALVVAVTALLLQILRG